MMADARRGSLRNCIADTSEMNSRREQIHFCLQELKDYTSKYIVLRIISTSPLRTSERQRVRVMATAMPSPCDALALRCPRLCACTQCSVRRPSAGLVVDFKARPCSACFAVRLVYVIELHHKSSSFLVDVCTIQLT